MCFLHLSRLLTWSCDLLSAPQLNPTLLLRTIEVFLDPSTFRHDHAPIIIGNLCTHLIKRRFFHSLLTLLQLKTPPPEDPSTTPTPLASSLLGYLTCPLTSCPERQMVYESLANEILSCSDSPHVSYCVLPHLVRSDINMSAVVSSILTGVTSGGVAPSPELLYAVVQLTHSRLTADRAGADLLPDYLHLLSLLLGSAPSSHVTAGVESVDDDDDSGDDMEIDPLSSRDAMLHHSLIIIGGDQLPKCIQHR